ncbi:MAG TPA: DUF3788 domain-containing protein [Armatimonadota bacterium]|nr:DUF3788 domain-containing protein [Armatimonadota bacterium]
MDVIHNPNVTPDISVIEDSMGEEARGRWRALTAHIEDAYGAKPQIMYSVCAGQPGWNVKYKKGSKALCTLYPEPESFIALVVLARADMDKLDAVRLAYTPGLLALYDGCRLFNNTKWLMIRVNDEAVLDDVKRLLALKTAKA